MICPATDNELDEGYCDGDCINCPWMAPDDTVDTRRQRDEACYIASSRQGSCNMPALW